MKHVRPVGIWRFLTPMDTVQVDDLGRMVCTSDPEAASWSPITEDAVWWFGNGPNNRVLGARLFDIQAVDDGWEFIRSVDESSTYIVLKEDTD